LSVASSVLKYPGFYPISRFFHSIYILQLAFCNLQFFSGIDADSVSLSQLPNRNISKRHWIIVSRETKIAARAILARVWSVVLEFGHRT